MAYEHHNDGELILRDRLALERTKLANERTMLAYARTAIMLGVSGVTLLKLFASSGVMLTSGWLLVALGSGTMVYGAKRFLAKNHDIDSITRS